MNMTEQSSRDVFRRLDELERLYGPLASRVDILERADTQRAVEGKTLADCAARGAPPTFSGAPVLRTPAAVGSEHVSPREAAAGASCEHINRTLYGIGESPKVYDSICAWCRDCGSISSPYSKAHGGHWTAPKLAVPPAPAAAPKCEHDSPWKRAFAENAPEFNVWCPKCQRFVQSEVAGAGDAPSGNAGDRSILDGPQTSPAPSPAARGAVERPPTIDNPWEPKHFACDRESERLNKADIAERERQYCLDQERQRVELEKALAALRAEHKALQDETYGDDLFRGRAELAVENADLQRRLNRAERERDARVSRETLAKALSAAHVAGIRGQAFDVETFLKKAGAMRFDKVTIPFPDAAAQKEGR